MPFAKDQPKPGEIILYCGHTRGKMHAFHNGAPMAFTRPDGTTGAAQWVTICDRCLASGLPPDKLVRGDAVWRGDAPAFNEIPLEDRPTQARGW